MFASHAPAGLIETEGPRMAVASSPCRSSSARCDRGWRIDDAAIVSINSFRKILRALVTPEAPRLAKTICGGN